MEDKKTRTTKKIDLLTSIESIVYLAKESKLNKEFYRKADKYLKYMSEKLELTKEESVMIAMFINWSDNGSIYPLDDILLNSVVSQKNVF